MATPSETKIRNLAKEIANCIGITDIDTQRRFIDLMVQMTEAAAQRAVHFQSSKESDKT